MPKIQTNLSSSMADSEPNNTPSTHQLEEEINNPNQTEPILIEDDEELEEQIEVIEFDDDTDDDYRSYLRHYLAGGTNQSGLENPFDSFFELVAGVSDDDDDDDEDYVDGDDDDDLDEEEDDWMVTSPRVSVDSMKGGEMASEEKLRGEVGEIDRLMCPICMGAWTSGGGPSSLNCSCLPCGHIYGLSCIRRWLEHRKGSAKCPQCNRKCKPKDVRVLYASRVVVADEESKEKIQFLEAKCALLEDANAHLHKKNEDLLEVVDIQSKQVATQTERVQYWIDTQQSQIDAIKADQKAYEQRVLRGMAAAGIDASDWPSP